MSFTDWFIFAGALLISLVLLGTLVERLPLSSAMLYLVVGGLLGPAALGVLTPDPFRHTQVLELVAELALLISLFSVGLQLGVPLRDRRWWLPIRLAFASMLATVALISLVGVWLLDLPLGAAVLLGAVLAPTDPVLASGVPSDPGRQPDRLGFSLAGEGGLNDGAAFPFVMLGLGLSGLLAPGPWVLRWWTLDLLWSTLGGLAIGGAIGALVGRLVVHLRSRHGEAVGLDVFLGLGLVALAYGLTQRLHASGFLAVFAAGLALRRVRERPIRGVGPLAPATDAVGHDYEVMATHSHHASATMRDAIQRFNGQVEKLGELALVLLVGAMLPYAPALPAAAWFVPLLLVVVRPLSAWPATLGEDLTRPQSVLIAWFGIRGIGSIYYMLFALRHGVDARTADVLVSLTLWSVAASIIVHGLTTQPLMDRYRVWRKRRSARLGGQRGRAP